MDHFSSLNLLWHGQECHCVSKCVYVWQGCAGGGHGRHRKLRGTARGRGGRPGSIVVHLLWFLLVLWQHKAGSSLAAQLSNQVTSSWQTQTRAHKDLNTQRRARTCMHTSHMQPAAVANDVSPDLAKVAFCFTAWTEEEASFGSTVRLFGLGLSYWLLTEKSHSKINTFPRLNREEKVENNFENQLITQSIFLTSCSLLYVSICNVKLLLGATE